MKFVVGKRYTCTRTERGTGWDSDYHDSPSLMKEVIGHPFVTCIAAGDRNTANFDVINKAYPGRVPIGCWLWSEGDFVEYVEGPPVYIRHELEL